MLTPFQNEPDLDFENPQNVAIFQEALIRARETKNRVCPLILGATEMMTSETWPSVMPADPSQVFAVAAQANEQHAREAIEIAVAAFEEWRKMLPRHRSHYLLKAAQIIRQHKEDFAAGLVYEVGKSWEEADSEVSKVIDFIEYHARQMLALSSPETTITVPGEETEMLSIPLGTGVLFPPASSPMATTTGMLSAAIVTGNTVVMCPDESAPACTALIVNVFRQIKLPPGVVNFLPTTSNKVREFLIDHIKTRFIAYSGSTETGLWVHRRASVQHPDQIWIKRTILEMSGKNAVVVDETADLEAAAEGIVTSAFGFQGQKFSAASRAILVEPIYQEIVSRIIRKTRMLRVGNPDNPLNRVGPVMHRQAYDRILDYIERGQEEGTLLSGGVPVGQTGYFIAPTIFGDVEPDAALAQEPIFGPVLACIRARDFGHALQIANNTAYGMAGSVYSSDRRRLEQARQDLHVGNLYFNRKCTGAVIGMHPSGGFNLSGTDPNMGGSTYLLLFSQGKAIGERL